jgi:phenylalanine-4-hydroxylase
MALAPSLTLPSDHPGLSDPGYRARRQEIASVGETFHSGDPIPVVRYTDEEHGVWRLVSSELASKHGRDACEAYLRGAEAVSLPKDRVPQLAWVSKRLTELTRFRIEPVPGLVPTRRFYGSLADRCFLSTQYVRHPSVPLYTPEPDVIHEVIGHTNQLGHPLFADLYEAMGRAVRRVETEEALDRLSRVWWFTLEFGVVHERGDLKTYGAGILSSFGELDAYRDARIRPFDLKAMETQDYDITTFQPVLFAAESMDQVADELTRYFDAARD